MAHPLSTQWLHWRCDCPSAVRKAVASFWPDRCASPMRIRAKTRREREYRPQCVARTILYPVSRCTESRQYTSLQGTMEQSYPDLSVFPSCVHPTQLLTSIPRPGAKVRRWKVRPTSWEILRLEHSTRPAHATSCKLPDTCCKGASSPTAGRQTVHRVLSLNGLVPPRASRFVCDLRRRRRGSDQC